MDLFITFVFSSEVLNSHNPTKDSKKISPITIM